MGAAERSFHQTPAVRLVGDPEADEKPVDPMSATVHELRTPLTSILGQAQLALRYLDNDPQRARQAIVRTVEQANRMNKLISDLLDNARVTVGAVTLDPVVFDLGPAIAREILHYEHGDAPRIGLRLPAGPVTVRADPLRIAQIIGNLLDNAIKFSPAGSPIGVSVLVVGDEAQVLVEDDGIGVAPGERDRIFAPFYRTTEARNIPGTGLGLHISRRLAEQHGGRLWLEKSADPVPGTVFTLALPLFVPVTGTSAAKVNSG